MSKPSNGMCYFIYCPYCGNHKSTTIDYKDYTLYKCTKCKKTFEQYYKEQKNTKK